MSQPDTTPNTTNLDAALGYAARGWRVIPVPPGQKHPAIVAWQTAGTTDVDRITHWWTEQPDAGIGIVTGRASNLWVLDVDEHGGISGGDTLRELEDAYGPLPDTYENITGSGGRHLFFTWPTDGKTIRNSAGNRLGPGLDVRGEGGQVIAPPSIHPNGNRYSHEVFSHEHPDAPPGWLLHLAADDTTEPSSPPRERAPSADSGTRPGDLWSAQITWPQLLEPDGWTLHHVNRDGEEHWTRPGKERREGTSATVGYRGSNVLKVFTSSVPTLEADKTYTKFGYYAAMRHNGDHSAAGRALKAEGFTVTDPDMDPLNLIGNAATGPTEPRDGHDEDEDDGLPRPIDWTTFWTREINTAWLIEPLIPAGRHCVLYAPAKAGKSLLALEIAAAAATGRPVLGQPAQQPVDVVYFDLEMTEDDVQERLEDMGYGTHVDMSHLHYYSLPDLPPLDTLPGGQTIHRIAARHGAQLIVIDTMARAVAGPENDADTYRTFDRFTSRAIKKAGIAVLRLDHTGKDTTLGQRGSSEKVGYADVVWEMSINHSDVTLKATHKRIGWVPENVCFTRIEDPWLTHERELIDRMAEIPAGTAECIEHLDQLGAADDLSTNRCLVLLREAGMGKRRNVVAAAVKSRTKRGESLGTPPGTPGNPPHQNGWEPPREPPPPKRSDQHGNPPGTPGNPPPGTQGTPPPLRGEGPSPTSETDETDIDPLDEFFAEPDLEP